GAALLSGCLGAPHIQLGMVLRRQVHRAAYLLLTQSSCPKCVVSSPTCRSAWCSSRTAVCAAPSCSTAASAVSAPGRSRRSSYSVSSADFLSSTWLNWSNSWSRPPTAEDTRPSNPSTTGRSDERRVG